MLWLLWVGCTKTVPVGVAPMAAPAPVEIAETEPEAGWYNGACFAALAGDRDTALSYLQQSIRRGEAPLKWMGEDRDLIDVRVDPRYLPMRDAAIDAWAETAPKKTSADQMHIAAAREVQGRDPTAEVQLAESLGHVHAVFQAPIDADTPALGALRAEREAFIARHRGVTTVEIPEVFELANIVLSLTEYGQDPNATDRSSPYAEAADAWFSPHRDHPLIAELDAIPVDVWVYYAFRNQAAAWEFEGDSLVPSRVYPQGGLWGGTDPFSERIAAIEDFARVSKAQEFLAAEREVLQAHIATYEEEVPIQSMWDWLEAHFPAEGDGRDSLVVRSSLLIGGSHNASTLELPGFSQGTMVVPILSDGPIEAEHIGPLSRMVFTEIDHHYVNPVSDRMRAEIDAKVDYPRFNGQDDGYANAYLTFNEYVTWVLFDVWWREWCDENACTDAQRAAGERDTIAVMDRRKFHRYEDFRDAMLPKLAGQEDLEAMFPTLLSWFEQQSESEEASPEP